MTSILQLHFFLKNVWSRQMYRVSHAINMSIKGQLGDCIVKPNSKNHDKFTSARVYFIKVFKNCYIFCTIVNNVYAIFQQNEQ